MRRSALFLAFVVTLTSLVGLFNPAAYAAATLSADSTTPFVGQEVTMKGDTGTSGARPVVLQAQSGSNWVVVRSTTSSADGSFTFQVGTPYPRHGFRAVAQTFAPHPAVISNIVTLTTKSVEGAPKTATLASSPKRPYALQTFTLSGTAGSDWANRKVILQGRSGSGWTASRSSTTDASGNYKFSLATAFDREFRVLVPSFKLDGPVLSPPLLIDMRNNTVSLVLNRSGSTIVADGYLSANQEGRRVELQRATSVWTTIAVAAQDGDNRVQFNGALESSRNYRLVARLSADGAPQVISNVSALTRGPSNLGPRVTYVATRSGATPRTRGVDYPATVVMNGVIATLETIAVRGNSSAEYAKQGYKIHFDDNIKPFGVLPEGKNFNLLPNLQDHSLLRTAVAFTTAKKLNSGLKWTPNRVFTELYLNGKYRGSYELIESVKIEQEDDNTAARVSIDEKTGVIMEFDHKPETALFSFRLGRSGNYIKFKDPDERKGGEDYYEGITGDKVQKMKARLVNFESVLYGSNWKSDTAGWKAYLDLNSAVDFYLYSEFIKNWDGDMFASVFVYTNDYRNASSKLVMSPVWDPDRSAGAKTSGTSNVTSTAGWWMNGDGGGHLNQTGDVHTTHWFTRLTDDPDFMAAVRARWNQPAVRGAFFTAGRTTLDQLAGELSTTAAKNDERMWEGYMPAGRYASRGGSWESNVRFIRAWYQGRWAWMDKQL